MRELGKIVDLGKVADLGKVVNLGGGVIYPAESQGGSGDNPVQRILDSMPSELRAALVAWYWPKGQGITNEYLLDGYLSEEGTSVLKDLSGHGYDMTLYGMTGEEGNGYINDDGNLVFDGRDDYARRMGAVITSSTPTIIYRFSNATGCLLMDTNAASAAIVGVIRYGSSASQYVKVGTSKWVGATNMPTTSAINDKVVVHTTESYQGVAPTTTEAASTPKMLNIANYPPNNGRYLATTMYELIAFSRTLTDEEATWVTTNMINI